MPRGGGRLAAYRRAGADPPFGDARRLHGVPMEGYYWRITDVASGRVLVALCGVTCGAREGSRATVALAAHPGGPVRALTVPAPRVSARGLGIDAGALRATEERLVVDLGAGARIDAAFERPRGWSRPALGGLGVAHMVPGLSQYWHPHLLGARVTGTAEIGAARVAMGGATAYAEKNWGAGFPARWWWGQAQGFADDACVAFAGGLLEAGGLSAAATSLVVRLDGRLLRFVAPAALVRARVGDGRWSVRARGPRLTAEVEAEAGASPPARLPVPSPGAELAGGHVDQHLAGRLRVVLRAGRRIAWRGESLHAGLEHGLLSRAVPGMG